jgi:chorismate synthase
VLRFLVAGESPGRELTVIIDGVPAGLAIDEETIQRDLVRQHVGISAESSELPIELVDITSGVRAGQTSGGPISIIIRAGSWSRLVGDSGPLTSFDRQPLPTDVLLSGTAARVAAGAVARRFLDEFGVAVRSHTVAIGGVLNPLMEGDERDIDWDTVESSVVRCADPSVSQRMVDAIEEARLRGDTVGGIFEIIAVGVPSGVGSRAQWDKKLSSRLGQALLSISGSKGVEIGGGFRIAHLRGSEVHDVIRISGEPGNAFGWSHVNNRAGGIVGGMTNGEAIVVRVALRPPYIGGIPAGGADAAGDNEVSSTLSWQQACHVPGAGIIGESMLALVVAQSYLEKFGGDHLAETRRNFEAYVRAIQRESEIGEGVPALSAD